jgi:hypothetical protein
MNLESFRSAISAGQLPEGLPAPLQSLWLDGGGDWEKAHELINEMDDRDACWVHAYLHRKEGDLPNAAYWYRRAGKRVSDLSLSMEWEEISKSLLGDL